MFDEKLNRICDGKKFTIISQQIPFQFSDPETGKKFDTSKTFTDFTNADLAYDVAKKLVDDYSNRYPNDPEAAVRLWCSTGRGDGVVVKEYLGQNQVESFFP